MDFILRAALGSGYKQSMSAAASSLGAVQAQVNALNSHIGDIRAFQRQQEAVERTTNKLSDLQRMHQNTQSELERTGGASSKLQNEEIKQARAISDTQTQLDRMTQKLEQYKQILADAGIDVSKLTDDEKELAQSLKKGEVAAQDATDVMKTGFEAVAGVLAAAGIEKALSAIAQGFKECLDASAEFSYSMSAVEAITDADSSGIAAMTEEATRLGATTVYTSTQVAEGMKYMGMAGWDAQEVLAGISSVVDLAAASGEEFGTVSDIVTDDLTAFGLAASDAGHFADILAQAAVNSNTNVGLMGVTFRYAAPLAAAMGYTVEDVATAVGLLANSGIKGSMAGTALRNIFNGLASGKTIASEAFGEIELSASNADGTMKSFSQTIQELRGYFSQMSEAEQIANAKNIATLRGVSGFLALMNTTDADFEKLADDINNCAGAARKMADTRLDNLKGDMTLLSSAADNLKIILGSLFEEDARDVVQAGTGVVQWLDDLILKFPVASKSVITGAGAFVGLLGAVAGVGTLVKTLPAAFTAMATALNLNVTTIGGLMTAIGPFLPAVLGIAAGVGVLAGGFAALNGYVEKTTQDVREFTAASYLDKKALEEATNAYNNAVATYGANSAEAILLKGRVDDLTAAYENNKQTMDEWRAETEAAIEAIKQKNDELGGALKDVDKAAEDNTVVIDRLTEYANKANLTKGELLQVKALLEYLGRSMPELNVEGAYEAFANGGGKNTAEFVKDVARQNYKQQKFDAAMEGFGEAEVNKDNARTAAANRVREWQEAVAAYDEFRNNDLPNMLGGDAVNVGSEPTWFDRNIKGRFNPAQATYNELYDKMMSARAAMDEAINEVVEADRVYNEYNDVLEEVGEAQDAAAESGANYAEALNAAIAAAEEAAAAFQESFAGQYDIWDDVSSWQEDVTTSFDDLMTGLNSQISYWSEYNANVENLLSRAGDIAGLKDVIATFADGSEESAGAIAAMAAASDEDLKKMVAAFEENKGAQKSLSENLAALTTDIKNYMDEAADSVESAVEQGTNQASRAKQNGVNTKNGWLNGLNGIVEQTQSLMNAVADAVNSLGSLLKINSPSKVTQSFGEFVSEGFALGIEGGLPGVEKAVADMARKVSGVSLTLPEIEATQGYDTLAGLSIPVELNAAGQNPFEELLSAVEKADRERVEPMPQMQAETLSGGDRIYNAAPININVNVSGNADRQTVTALNAYSDDLADRIRAIIEEDAQDARRRAL